MDESPEDEPFGKALQVGSETTEVEKEYEKVLFYNGALFHITLLEFRLFKTLVMIILTSHLSQ